MALKTQDVTLRIVYDDSIWEGNPSDWDWAQVLETELDNVQIIGYSEPREEQ